MIKISEQKLKQLFKLVGQELIDYRYEEDKPTLKDMLKLKSFYDRVSKIIDQIFSVVGVNDVGFVVDKNSIKEIYVKVFDFELQLRQKYGYFSFKKEKSYSVEYSRIDGKLCWFNPICAGSMKEAVTKYKEYLNYRKKYIGRYVLFFGANIMVDGIEKNLETSIISFSEEEYYEVNDAVVFLAGDSLNELKDSLLRFGFTEECVFEAFNKASFVVDFNGKIVLSKEYLKHSWIMQSKHESFIEDPNKKLSI